MNIYNKDIQENRLCKILYKSYVKKVKKKLKNVLTLLL